MARKPGSLGIRAEFHRRPDELHAAALMGAGRELLRLLVFSGELRLPPSFLAGGGQSGSASDRSVHLSGHSRRNGQGGRGAKGARFKKGLSTFPVEPDEPEAAPDVRRAKQIVRSSSQG